VTQLSAEAEARALEFARSAPPLSNEKRAVSARSSGATSLPGVEDAVVIAFPTPDCCVQSACYSNIEDRSATTATITPMRRGA
jgi:hypothetical protein